MEYRNPAIANRVIRATHVIYIITKGSAISFGGMELDIIYAVSNMDSPESRISGLKTTPIIR